jgi:hypothetical protein
LHRVEDVTDTDTVDTMEDQDGKNIMKPALEGDQVTEAPSKNEDGKWTIKPLLKDVNGRSVSTE